MFIYFRIEITDQLNRQKFAMLSLTKSYDKAANIIKARRVDLLRKLVLTHPNLLHVKDVFNSDEKNPIVIVHEYVNGGEIFDTVKKMALAEHDVSRIARQLLAAVVFLHDRDIVHRNIRPGNIFFQNKDDPLNRVKLGNFCELCDSSESYKFITLDEENDLDTWFGAAFAGFTATNPTKSFDVWCVGAVVYALLCGSLPFSKISNKNLPSVMAAGPAFSEPGWAAISSSAKGFVAELMEPDRRRRRATEYILEHSYLTDYDVLSHSCLPHQLDHMTAGPSSQKVRFKMGKSMRK